MNTHTVTITSPQIWKRVQAEATKVRMSVDEYVSRIVKTYITRHDPDPWGPVPKKVSQRWDRELAAFDKEDKKNPRPVFTSGADFVAYMRNKP